LQAYLEERYCISVSSNKIFGGTALPRVPSTKPRDVSHNNDFQWIDFVLWLESNPNMTSRVTRCHCLHVLNQVSLLDTGYEKTGPISSQLITYEILVRSITAKFGINQLLKTKQRNLHIA